MSGYTINKTILAGLTHACKPSGAYGDPNNLAMTFYPGYTRADGKQIQDRVVIPAYMNGANDRTDRINVVVWGKLAQTICKTLTPGRSFSVAGRLESYLSVVRDANRNPIIGADGQPIQVTRHSVVVESRGFKFDEESRKFIANEIQRNARPADWDVEGSQGQAQHIANLKARAAGVYNGEPTFGYAKVRLTEGVNYNFRSGLAQVRPQPQTGNGSVYGYVSETLNGGPQPPAANPNPVNASVGQGGMPLF